MHIMIVMVYIIMSAADAEMAIAISQKTRCNSKIHKMLDIITNG